MSCKRLVDENGSLVGSQDLSRCQRVRCQWHQSRLFQSINCLQCCCCHHPARYCSRNEQGINTMPTVKVGSVSFLSQQGVENSPSPVSVIWLMLSCRPTLIRLLLCYSEHGDTCYKLTMSRHSTQWSNWSEKDSRARNDLCHGTLSARFPIYWRWIRSPKPLSNTSTTYAESHGFKWDQAPCKNW